MAFFLRARASRQRAQYTRRRRALWNFGGLSQWAASSNKYTIDVNINEWAATPLDYACAYADYEGVVRRIYPVLLRAGAALPALGTDQWERTIGRYSTLNPIRRQADYLYLQSVAAAGGYRNYERNHLNALSGIFVPKFSRVLPPEMVRRVVEYAFDVGGH